MRRRRKAPIQRQKTTRSSRFGWFFLAGSVFKRSLVYQRGAAGEGNTLVGVIYDQVAAEELHRDVRALVAQAVFHRRDDRGARARAAGERFAVAALPHAHAQVRAVHHAHKLRVDALREQRRVLEFRADLLQLQPVNRVAEDDAVRVADGDARRTPVPPRDRERSIH